MSSGRDELCVGWSDESLHSISSRRDELCVVWSPASRYIGSVLAPRQRFHGALANLDECAFAVDPMFTDLDMASRRAFLVVSSHLVESPWYPIETANIGWQGSWFEAYEWTVMYCLTLPEVCDSPRFHGLTLHEACN